MSSAALVSIAGGERYLRCWHEVAKPTWTAYAERHGLDIVLIRFPIDRAARAQARSIAWQKCLIPGQAWARHYRRLCWIDADILINPDAPNLFEETAEDGISATLVHDQLSSAEKHVLLERVHRRRFAETDVTSAWSVTQTGLYKEAGIDTSCVDMVHTGVIAFSPDRDESVFAAAYARDRDTIAYEQPSLSHEILQSGRLRRMSARWNWGLYDAIVIHHQNLLLAGDQISGSITDFAAIASRELQNAHFLHFYRLFGILEALRPTAAARR
ncbi:MAG: hypothetical protein HYR63_24695 [Proteobacteria bacterium]|nr:hypothetical protein [Pseudomonadota bacterium]